MKTIYQITIAIIGLILLACAVTLMAAVKGCEPNRTGAWSYPAVVLDKRSEKTTTWIWISSDKSGFMSPVFGHEYFLSLSNRLAVFERQVDKDRFDAATVGGTVDPW